MDLYWYQGREYPHIRRIRLWYKRAQAQARHRGQTWSVSWPYFLSQWLINDRWQQHGHLRDQLIFARCSSDLPWSDTTTQVRRRGHAHNKV